MSHNVGPIQPNHPEGEYKDGEDSGTDKIRIAQKRKYKKSEILEKLRNIIDSSDLSRGEKIKKVRRWLDCTKHHTALFEYASERRGKLPPIFQLLSMEKVSPDLLETLVAHAPKAVQLSKYLGDSSLHYALNKNCSIDILRILLNSYPEIVRVTTNFGDLPIHCGVPQSKETVEILLQAYPEGATVQNRVGYLPLHQAVMYGYMEVTKILLDVYPEGARVTDNLGRLPLHLLCAMQSQLNKLDIRGLNQIIEPYPESITQKNVDGDEPSNLIITLDPWRTNMPFIMIPAERQARLVSRLHLKIAWALHGAVVEMFSPYLVKLLIKASPQSCTAKDQNGKIPLHHACARITVRSLDIVIVLLEASAESFMIPDENGITPSQLFSNAASQKNHSGMLPLHRHARYSERFTVSALRQLFNAYPKGIEERDNRGMLPFHHACLNTASSVDTLMALLQLYPESIAK